ncbi:MAG TPA: restriction endonuclease subunit S [Alphaproteobacteria bacterium]|nr:restriction endonuclease subunit S [Alphaproteobacteria bacterium]
MRAERLITEYFDKWTGAITYGGGKSRNNNGEPELTGIDKLRELILELAVSGKLAYQDPNDEPASELVRALADEKARLYNEGRIRRPKEYPEIGASESPFVLPESWEWVRLGDVGQIVGGGTPKSGEPAYWCAEGVTWLTPADLYGYPYKYISEGRRDISEKGLHESSATLVPTGTVLFSSRAPIGYVAIAGRPLATNQGFKSCVPYVDGMAEHLYYFLKRSAKEIDAKASGTTFKEISGSKMALVPVALPPLGEQTRIVERIDELMALCDRLEQKTSDQISAHETLVDTLLDTLTRSQDADELAVNWARMAAHFDTLFTTEHSIDRLEQTVLKLAVIGRLVPQIAEEEPASDLLDRIVAEKRRRGVRQTGMQGAESNEESARLPDGWLVQPLGEVVINRDAERIPVSVEERKNRKGEYDYYGASGVTKPKLSRASYGGVPALGMTEERHDLRRHLLQGS